MRAVRIDSGDLAAHARQVRRILDQAGLTEVEIFASGGLDEDELRALAGAPITGFGIGTALTVSSDAPALDCAYKLQEYAGRARRKISEGKRTWPGRKQVFHRFTDDGRMAGDTLGLLGEALPGEALLQPVMRKGRRLHPAEPLDALRQRATRSLQSLPADLTKIPFTGREEDSRYNVDISNNLRRTTEEVDVFLRKCVRNAESKH